MIAVSLWRNMPKSSSTPLNPSNTSSLRRSLIANKGNGRNKSTSTIAPLRTTPGCANVVADNLSKKLMDHSTVKSYTHEYLHDVTYKSSRNLVTNFQVRPFHF